RPAHCFFRLLGLRSAGKAARSRLTLSRRGHAIPRIEYFKKTISSCLQRFRSCESGKVQQKVARYSKKRIENLVLARRHRTRGETLMASECPHIDTIRNVTPSALGC